MAALRILVFSQPDARMPVSVWDKEYSQTPSRQIRDAQYIFEPSKVPGVRQLAPAAAVFIGSSMVFNAQGMVDFADQMSEQGAVVILDINPRKPVDSGILKLWAQHAQIIKIGMVDVPHYGTDVQATAACVAGDMLGVGTVSTKSARLVLVTDGKSGATVYWQDQGELKQLHIAVTTPLDILNEVGAGDGFDAGLAVAIREMGMTSQQIAEGLDPSRMTEMILRAHGISGQALMLYNAPEQQRPLAMQPIIRNQLLETIIGSLQSGTVLSHDGMPKSSSAVLDSIDEAEQFRQS